MKIFLKSYSSDYFCRNNTERLKGGLSLAVLLHHLYQKTNIVGHDSLLGFFMQSFDFVVTCILISDLKLIFVLSLIFLVH